MIYEHFRVTVSHGTILELSDLVNITLKGHNVQGFDAKWDEVLLSVRDAPKDEHAGKYVQNNTQRFGTVEDHFCSVQS